MKEHYLITIMIISLITCCTGGVSRTEDVTAKMNSIRREKWNKIATPPKIYDPPQKSWKNRIAYCLLRAKNPFWRMTSKLESFDLLDHENVLNAFSRMNVNCTGNCDDEFNGIWWMRDNVASEGILTFGDSIFTNNGSVFYKFAEHQWTLDQRNVWGGWLSYYFGNHVDGIHLFERMPVGNRKWVAITRTRDKEVGLHWIYILDETDKLQDENGNNIEFTAGETFLRVSYAKPFSQEELTYQYLVQRIAKRAHDGSIKKTKYFADIEKAAKRKNSCVKYEREFSLPIIDRYQMTNFTPSFRVTKKAAATSFWYGLI